MNQKQDKMEIEHILMQTINDTELLRFIDRHKEKINKSHVSEIDLRKVIFKCVSSDIKDGRLVHHTFNIGDDDLSDYSIRAEYMSNTSIKNCFLVESSIINNEHIYKTHECTVVGSNESNSIVEYKDNTTMLSSIIPNHRLFPLSYKKEFEKRAKELNKKREEIRYLENNLYDYA